LKKKLAFSAVPQAIPPTEGVSDYPDMQKHKKMLELPAFFGQNNFL
jgi:hypothetical protein